MNDYFRKLTQFYLVTLLDEAALPPSHADRIILRCEEFENETADKCAARLQYQMLFARRGRYPAGTCVGRRSTHSHTSAYHPTDHTSQTGIAPA